MTFQPVARRSVSDGVFVQLRRAIVDGTLPAGEMLPAERDLAAAFQVNRHAVREAIKRLQQAGLVEVVHGGGTRVLDLRRSGGLDLLPHLIEGGQAPAQLLRAGLEMRRCVGVEAARLAALRADDRARAAISSAADAYDQPDGDRRFWAAVVDAADNIAFRLAFNSLLQAIDAHAELMGSLLANDRRDAAAHRALAAAIVAGDVDLAVDLAGELLTRALTAATPLIGGPSLAPSQ